MSERCVRHFAGGAQTPLCARAGRRFRPFDRLQSDSVCARPSKPNSARENGNYADDEDIGEAAGPLAGRTSFARPRRGPRDPDRARSLGESETPETRATATSRTRHRSSAREFRGPNL